jgi:hypothetical protein
VIPAYYFFSYLISNPGLTAAETTLVLKGMPSVKTLKELNNLKSVILKFIEVCRRSTIFSHDDFLPIAIIAFGDTTSQISEKGEDLVKSLKQVDLENKSSLTLLFQMFVGVPNGAEKKYVS